MTSAYTINLNPNITTPVKTGYTFKAGDKGITFNLVVQEMDPTGTSAKIAFHRANGTSVEASLAGGGPNYSYTILGNEFAVPGVVVADVKFYQSTTQRVSTASFIFNVIGDTLDGLGGGTAGYSDELETLRATMEGYIEAFGELSPMKPRGAYSSSTQYYPGDCVTLNSASWLCIQPCKNVTPNDGAYWQKVVEVADPTKADKVNGATNGNLAALNASGNLTDSGVAASSVPGKADKVSGATANNLAALNASGNLIDSGLDRRSIPYIEQYITFGGSNMDRVITFSGDAVRRTPHFLLIIAGQSGVFSPITISFVGGSTARGAIISVLISDTLGGYVTASGMEVAWNCQIGGNWGCAILLNIIPTDPVTYTLTQRSRT